MAEGKKPLPPPHKWRHKHFFFNDDLHRVLRINRPTNLVEAWNYRLGKSVILLYSDWKKHGKKAYMTSEVCALLNVDVETLKKIRRDGSIRQPQKSFPIGGSSNPTTLRGKNGTNWWSDKNIIEALEFMLTVQRGRPRADGMVTPNRNLPSMAELKGKLENRPTLYVRTEDGQFVPTFEQPIF